MAAQFVMGIANLAGSIAQSEAYREQGRYAESMANINARFAEIEARDILKRGEQDAVEHGKSIRRMIGTQRARTAASNIVVDSGTAGDIVDETREIAYEERKRIRSNAWRQAFGLKQEARFGRIQGRLERATGNFQANQTLVTGALQLTGTALESFGKNSSNKTEDKLETREVVQVFDPASYNIQNVGAVS